MIRAKFDCENAVQVGQDSHDVTLRAVTSGSPENEAFFDCTPNGCITMTTKKPLFEKGKTYYVDFTETE